MQKANATTKGDNLEIMRAGAEEYREKYGADAINLRDEMLRRLPPMPNRHDFANSLYEQPNPNMLTMVDVANDLEMLAKRLPAEP